MVLCLESERFLFKVDEHNNVNGFYYVTITDRELTLYFKLLQNYFIIKIIFVLFNIEIAIMSENIPEFVFSILLICCQFDKIMFYPFYRGANFLFKNRLKRESSNFLKFQPISLNLVKLEMYYDKKIK